MASTNGQQVGTEMPAGRGTRPRLLGAASDLIGERGWGRVTTRAIAEKAGLPHGTVSYHFRGKQQLLVEAAQRTVQQMFSMEALREVGSLSELIAAATGGIDASAPEERAAAGVLMEAMREATRDPGLREGLAEILREYRTLVADLVESDQRQGLISGRLTSETVARLALAMGDGLWLHSILEPDLEMSSAGEALLALFELETTQ